MVCPLGCKTTFKALNGFADHLIFFGCRTFDEFPFSCGLPLADGSGLCSARQNRKANFIRHFHKHSVGHPFVDDSDGGWLAPFYFTSFKSLLRKLEMKRDFPGSVQFIPYSNPLSHQTNSFICPKDFCFQLITPFGQAAHSLFHAHQGKGNPHMTFPKCCGGFHLWSRARTHDCFAAQIRALWRRRLIGNLAFAGYKSDSPFDCLQDCLRSVPANAGYPYSCSLEGCRRSFHAACLARNNYPIVLVPGASFVCPDAFCAARQTPAV